MTELEKVAREAKKRELTEQEKVENALYHYYSLVSDGKSASLSNSARQFGVPYWKVRDLHRKIQKELEQQQESEGDNE